MGKEQQLKLTKRDFLKMAGGAIALVGLAGCLPRGKETPVPSETPTLGQVPTEVPTAIPTEKPRPTPTIAPIEITPREIGGSIGEEMVVEYNGESQKLFKYTLSNGETFFLLGYYPKLPDTSERTDLENEVVYYDGQPFVFLTAMASLEGDREALPFYDRNVPEVGILRWIENGEGVSQQAAFEQLQEGEVSVQFPGNGNYEFLDKEGKILRTKGIFKPAPEVPIAEVLQLEGLSLVWQNGQWEYVDIDGQSIAYWDSEANEGKGRIELVENIKRLDFEKHRGLFVPWTASQAEAAFAEAWNHGNGEIRLPMPFQPTQGEIVVKEDLHTGLCLRNIPSGTILFAPFGGEVVRFGSEHNAGFDLVWSREEDLALHVYFKSFEDFTGPQEGRVEAGTPLLRISEKRLTEFAYNKYREYQAILSACEADWDEGFDISFENLLRDSQGRLVYLSP